MKNYSYRRLLVQDSPFTDSQGKFRTAENVSDAIIDLLGAMKKWVKTLTADNGKEFAFHELIAKVLNAKFYFAHPYSS